MHEHETNREIYCHRPHRGGGHYEQWVYLLSGEDTNGLRYGRGLVVASGTEVTAINAGDEIYYDKRGSYVMMIDDVRRTILSEREVVVVV